MCSIVRLVNPVVAWAFVAGLAAAAG